MSIGFNVGVGVGVIVGEGVGDGVALAVALGTGVAVSLGAGVALGCSAMGMASPAGLRAEQADNASKASEINIQNHALIRGVFIGVHNNIFTFKRSNVLTFKRSQDGRDYKSFPNDSHRYLYLFPRQIRL
jgi:hypothetical protein